MQKISSKYILSIVTLVIINLIYFAWQPYSKNILPCPIEDINIADIITNLFYFLMYFSVIIVIFNTVLCGKSKKKCPPKKASIIVAGLLCMQLIFDGIKQLILTFIPSVKYIFNDTCTISLFAISFVLLVKVFNLQPKKQYKQNIVYILLILTLLIYLCFETINIFNAMEMNLINKKYDRQSEIFVVIQQNYTFVHEMCSLIVETICCILVFSVFYIIYNGNNKKSYNNWQRYPKFIARILLITGGAIAVIAVKILILPHSAICPVSHTKAIVEVYDANEDNALYQDFEEIEITRYGKEKQNTVFIWGNYNFKVDNYSFFSYGMNNYSSLQLPDELYVLKEYNTGSIKFNVFGNELLILNNEQGKYSFYTLKELANNNYDEDVVNTVEHMISLGVFSFFEYGVEYLIKYDYEFIMPYIEKYSKGDFSMREIDNPYNYGINISYIQNIAQKFYL